MSEVRGDPPFREPARAATPRPRREWPALLLQVLWVVWLAALGFPLASLLTAPGGRVRLAGILALATAFVAVYLWTAWSNALRLPSPAAHWWPIAALGALSPALTLAAGPEWLVLFIFCSASAAGYLPTRPAMLAVGVLVILAATVGLLAGAPVALVGETAVRVATVGIAVASLTRAVLMQRELQAARAEIARLAVTEERLRFARDLHDLLGRSLSIIALKSELAERLMHTTPERAATEIRDVKTTARTALREVREAVAGYRQPALATELQGAEELLAAAGIAYSYAGTPGALPAPVETALAWAVREAVTNVVRHARARQCRIAIRRDPDEVALEVTDDGTPGAGEPSRPGGAERRIGGSGLTGLRERIAALGGRCDAGPLPGGGFRVAVALPFGSPPEAARVGELDEARSASRDPAPAGRVPP